MAFQPANCPIPFPPSKRAVAPSSLRIVTRVGSATILASTRSTKSLRYGRPWVSVPRISARTRLSATIGASSSPAPKPLRTSTTISFKRSGVTVGIGLLLTQSEDVEHRAVLYDALDVIERIPEMRSHGVLAPRRVLRGEGIQDLQVFSVRFLGPPFVH